MLGTQWIIDGLFGTGLKGELKAPYSGIIAEINSHALNSNSKIFAIDIPSGLDCDSGEPIATLEKTNAMPNNVPNDRPNHSLQENVLSDKKFAIRADYTATFIGQ